MNEITHLPQRPLIHIPFLEIDEMFGTVNRHAQVGTMDVSEVRNMLHTFEARLWQRFAEERGLETK